MQMIDRARRILGPLFILAFFNFLAFWIVGALIIEGNAFNGRVENGSYFLGNGGKLIEVSQAIYVYSYVHTLLVMLTHGAVFITAGVLALRGELNK
jgi:hypothetical protein